jgi:hypothetical protein
MEKVTAREVEEKVREVAAEDLPEHVYARNAGLKCPTKGEFHALLFPARNAGRRWCAVNRKEKAR